MEITLRINGEDKTFTQEFVPMKFHRKALEIYNEQKSENLDAEKNLNKQLNLIVEIFEKQFTKDQIENGLNAINHKEVLYDIIAVGLLGFSTREEIEKAEKNEIDLGKLLKEIKENGSLSNNELNK